MNGIEMKRIYFSYIVALVPIVITHFAFASPQSKTLEVLEQREIVAEQKVQQRVDALDEETKTLIEQYRRLSSEIDEAERLLPGLRTRAEELRTRTNEMTQELQDLQGSEATLMQLFSTMKTELAELGVSFKQPQQAFHEDKLSLGDELSVLLVQTTDMYRSSGSISVTEQEFTLSEKPLVFDRIDIGKLVSYALTKGRDRGFFITKENSLGAEMLETDLQRIKNFLSPKGERVVTLPLPEMHENVQR
jgi:chromosome segregation ATPase